MVSLTIEFTLEDFEIKKKRERILDEIKKNINALLNSTNGGELVLKASDATTDKKIRADSVIRLIEQWLIESIGLGITVEMFKWENNYNTITVKIKGQSILRTLITNLYLPIESSIFMLRDPESDDEIRRILSRRAVELEQRTVFEQFYEGCDSGLHESSSVLFKILKAQKTKRMNLAGRITENKLTGYVSAFANRSGGQIFYGIDGHGMVVGESLNYEKEMEEIKTKAENAIEKMIWPENIQCGKQWDIKFVPVKNGAGETLPLTFVIVITVFPCPGGVFTKKPESYHVVDGEVQEMSFESWKEKVKSKKRAEVPLEIGRIKWSSGDSEIAYMRVTEELVKLRHCGKWQKIKALCKILRENENIPINTKSVGLFHLIAAEYRQGNLGTAEEYLEELRKLSTDGDNDKWMTEIGEKYVASAIERSRGDYEEAWKIVEEGLQRCDNAPAGHIPAAFYANAASVLSKLVNNESFLGVKVQENVQKVEDLCDLALQHLEHIKTTRMYDFKIAKEELKQRIHITLASLYLRSECKDDSEAWSYIGMAAKKICEAETSLDELKKTEHLKFNKCRTLLAKCDLSLRRYQLTETDSGKELEGEFLRHRRKAREIAEEEGFEEILRGCNEREWIKKLELNERDESESDETLLNEWLRGGSQ